jgi:hypothetical protein
MYPLLFLLAPDALWTFLHRRNAACAEAASQANALRHGKAGRRPGPLPTTVESRAQSRFRFQFAAITAILLAGQVASAWAIAPHYLAYFSPIVGGPSLGHYLLGDSNIDWGQDLPLLRDQLERMGCRRALISYFGTAKIEAYGVHATPLESVPLSALFDYDCLAVSVNHISGIYPVEDPRLLAVAPMEPTARAGYSIFLYDLRLPEVRRTIEDHLRQIRELHLRSVHWPRGGPFVFHRFQPRAGVTPCPALTRSSRYAFWRHADGSSALCFRIPRERKSPHGSPENGRDYPLDRLNGARPALSCPDAGEASRRQCPRFRRQG